VYFWQLLSQANEILSKIDFDETIDFLSFTLKIFDLRPLQTPGRVILPSIKFRTKGSRILLL